MRYPARYAASSAPEVSQPIVTLTVSRIGCRSSKFYGCGALPIFARPPACIALLDARESPLCAPATVSSPRYASARTRRFCTPTATSTTLLEPRS